jgi:hypothetical protein
METVSEFLSFMETLRDFGGSLTIRDYDNTPEGADVSAIKHGAALYGYTGDVLKSTAQDAEEYFIDIPPIKLDQAMENSPWRRLMQVKPYL